MFCIMISIAQKMTIILFQRSRGCENSESSSTDKQLRTRFMSSWWDLPSPHNNKYPRSTKLEKETEEEKVVALKRHFVH